MKTCCKCKLLKSLDDFYYLKDYNKYMSQCKPCDREISKQYKLKNKDSLKIKNSLYFQNNKERCSAASKVFRIKNPDKYKKYSSKYRNNNKEKIRKSSQLYTKLNSGIVNFNTAKRRAVKKLATPSWLTKNHFKEIQEYYILAKELRWLSEDRLEVDHIVPLQGKDVCGLHVPWNLQILPRSLNASKNNKNISMDRKEPSKPNG